MGKEILKFDKYEVNIDPENLRFDEATLSKYITTEGGYYDNFGYFLALAERNLQNKESQYERIYCERFVEAKEDGASDKLAEAKAKADTLVLEFKESVFEARYAVNRLKNHLKAWDKNHDNAQSMGYMQRKLLDRLNSDTIYGSHGYQGNSIENEISQIVPPFEVPSADKGFADDLGISNLIGR